MSLSSSLSLVLYLSMVTRTTGTTTK
uniref:Uncharacterized protein n=1 Tax=Tetranychus urticae TaxID=32264 RepID=T1KB42_TETUR